MAALEDVQVKSSVGVDGNSYTTAVSNDTLTNDDFLKLMLEEMKMQDPTDPMDSSALMDSQLKMSTIQANVDMAAAMSTLKSAFANSSLSTAANLVGRVVEDGQSGEDGSLKSYKVQTVENNDGKLYVNVKEMLGYIDTVYNATNETFIRYDKKGELYDKQGNGLEIYVKMEDGRFTLDSDGKIILLDKEGDVITDSDIIKKYTYGGEKIRYSDELDKVLVSSIQKIW